MKDAQIVCRELGFLFTYSAPINASFGPGSGPVLQRNVQFKVLSPLLGIGDCVIIPVVTRQSFLSICAIFTKSASN